MISRPAAEKLIAEHGNTAAGRRKAREAMTAAILATARREALTAGFSMSCETRTLVYGVNHDPCGNPGGRTCLCQCHDPKEPDRDR